MSDATPQTKPKLLVILGAGSSVELGMPGVKDIDRLMRRRAQEYAADKQRTDFYRLVWQKRGCHLAKLRLVQDQDEFVRFTAEARTRPNYERCLGDMVSLMNAALPCSVIDPLQHALIPDEHLKTLGVPRGAETPHAIGEQFGFLVEHLAKLLRERCEILGRRVTRKDTAFDSYCALFGKLTQHFDLGVYNLNHDTVALTALQVLAQSEDSAYFTGFRDGRFAPVVVQARTDWRFIYHLHGSVHQCFLSEASSHEECFSKAPIRWEDGLGDREVVLLLPGQGGDRRLVVRTSLVAGGWKLDQLQVEPFQSFYSSFSRHVHEADAVLIAGYGFGDPHVDSVLANMLRARKDSRPPIMVLDYWSGRRLWTEYPSLAVPCGRWAQWNEKQWTALQCSSLLFRAAGRHATAAQGATISPLSQDEWSDGLVAGSPVDLPATEFALHGDPDQYLVALWFGGMLAAAEWKDEIAEWLLRHVPAR
ncbi:MAG: SIR2 family protein [Opitutaceae bacterium]